LAVIHLTCGLHQARITIGRMNDEPRIDRNAVTTHPWAGLKDVYPRVMIRQLNDLPYIDAKSLADLRELIGEGDVDVAEGVLAQLYHFSGAAIGWYQLTFDEGGIERRSRFGGSRGKTADYAVVVHQFGHHVSGNNPFRAVGNADVSFLSLSAREGQVLTQLGELLRNHFRGAHRGGGFQDNQVALVQNGRERSGCSFHVTEVRSAVLRHWCWYSNNEGFRRLRLRHRPQATAVD